MGVRFVRRKFENYEGSLAIVLDFDHFRIFLMATRQRTYYKYNLRGLPSAQRRGALSAVGKLKHHFRQALPKFALGQINPFDINVRGARVPDNNTAPSDTFCYQDENDNEPWDTTNNPACKAYTPTLSQVIVTASSNNSTSWVWPSSFGGQSPSGQATAIQAQYQLYRPVSHGIKIMAKSGLFNAEGFVHVCLYSGSLRGTTWDFPTTTGQMSEMPHYKKIPISQLISNGPVTVTNKYLDPSAHIYRDVTYTAGQASENEFMTNFGWMTILVAVVGTNAASKISVETIVHAEGTLRKGTFNQARAPEPSDGALYEAVASAVAQVNPIVQTIDETVSMPMRVVEFADNMAEQIANSSLGFLFEQTAPAAARVAAGSARRGIRAAANISRGVRERRRTTGASRARASRAQAIRDNRMGRTYDANADAL